MSYQLLVKLREFIKQWILPPKFYSFLKKLNNNSQKIEYLSYDEALDASDGYDNQKLINIIAMKTSKYIQQLQNSNFDQPPAYKLQILLIISQVIQEIDNRKMRILDVGGQLGSLYFEMKTYMKTNLIFEWVVLETPTMTARGNDEFANEELQFIDSISNLSDKNFDLIIAANSIQYAKDPFNLLTQIFQLNSAYLYLTRFPIKNNLIKNKIIIQKSRLSDNGPGFMRIEGDGFIQYPVNLLSGIKTGNLLKSFSDYQMTFYAEENSTMYSYGQEKIFGVSLLYQKIK